MIVDKATAAREEAAEQVAAADTKREHYSDSKQRNRRTVQTMEKTVQGGSKAEEDAWQSNQEEDAWQSNGRGGFLAKQWTRRMPGKAVNEEDAWQSNG